MIEWYWIPIVAVCSAIFGGGLALLMAGSAQDELTDDNAELREQIAHLKQVNHELGLFNSRQSGECAEGMEMQK